MTDLQKLLERQAAWQKRRAALSWEEKVRLAAAVRDCAARFRRQHSVDISAKSPGRTRPS